MTDIATQECLNALTDRKIEKITEEDGCIFIETHDKLKYRFSASIFGTVHVEQVDV